MVRASMIWAGGKMMERQWFGPQLFGRGGNNGWKMVWVSITSSRASWATEPIIFRLTGEELDNIDLEP